MQKADARKTMQPRSMRRVVSCLAWGLACACAVPGCFRPDDALRGQPCTSDGSCGGLACEFGVCGGPTRCTAGAGVGDYCFVLQEASFDAGPAPATLTVALVDGDARPDLVIGGADGSLTLLRTDGAGGFAAPRTSSPLGAEVRDLTVGRVDGSGWADIVATTSTGGVWLVRTGPGDDGAGVFEVPVSIAEGLDEPLRPQIGAFVDDPAGRADVAVLVRGGIDVREQVDPQTFSKPNQDTFVARPTDIRAFGQTMDIVYVGSHDAAELETLARNPNGAFTPRMPIPTGAPAQRFLIEDLTDDKYADVLAAGSDGALWLSRGKSIQLDKAAKPVAVYDLGWSPSLLASGALDDDVDREIIVAGGPRADLADIYLFDNDGDGGLVYGGALGLGDAIASASADLDGDGVTELVAIDGADARVRIARRTVAPPTHGGETTGVAETTCVVSTTQDATSSQESTAGTLPPPPTTGVDTEGQECWFLLAERCMVPMSVLGELPAGGKLLVEDLSGDGAPDLVIALDGGFIGYNGIPVTFPLTFDVMSPFGDSLAITGPTALAVRYGSEIPPEGDPGGDASNRLLIGHADGVLQWQGGSVIARAAPGVTAMTTGYFYYGLDAFAAMPVAYLDGAGLSVVDELEQGAADSVALEGRALAYAYESTTTLYVATDDGVQRFVIEGPGTGLEQLEALNAGLPIVDLAADPWSGILAYTDGTTLFASLYGQELPVSGGVAGGSEILFGDLDGDFLREVLVRTEPGGGVSIIDVFRLDENQTTLQLSDELVIASDWQVVLVPAQQYEPGRPDDFLVYLPDPNAAGLAFVVSLVGI